MKRRYLALSIIALFQLTIHTAAADGPYYRNLPAGQFMKQWLVLGPIQSKWAGRKEDRAALATDYLAGKNGEQEAAPKVGDSLQIEDQTFEWKLVRSPQTVVDLSNVLGKHNHSIAYAYAEVSVERSSKITLGIGSDDAVKVWLNGKLIHENSAGRPAAADTDLVTAKLNQGVNRLLLKVQNFTGPWGYCCREMDATAMESRLVAAAAANDRNLIERLLELGTNINGRNKLRLTSLNTARIKGYQQLADYLVSRGADPRIEPPPWQVLADKLVDGLVGDNSPGVAVLVSRSGEILFKSGYGFASLAHRAPVTPKTKFRIGSISKQFTAAAILKLQEEGKLSIDNTLDQYYPDYPRGSEVTLRHLLTHTSGIHSYTSKPDFFASAKSYIRPAKLIDSFKSDPFDFEPGKGWSYCNSGYFLLGEIVAQVAQESYASYLEHAFFQPLGMAETGVHHWTTILEHEASGYGWNGSGFDKALNWDMSRAGGAGAIYSTVEDLYRWNEAVFGGRVLDEQTLKEAFTPVAVSQTSPQGMPYGYGWVISQQRGLETISHGGGLQGFLSHLIRFPEQQVTLVALVNASPPAPGLAPSLITKEIAQLVLWEEMQPVSSHMVDKSVNPELFDAYVGKYDYGAPAAIMTVTKEGTQLFAQLTGQPKFEIFPMSASKFFWKVVAAEVKFVRNADGRVVKAVHRQSGRTIEAPKIE